MINRIQSYIKITYTSVCAYLAKYIYQDEEMPEIKNCKET
jgi:hypothetical protein